jgi:hypothetical protein
VLVPRLDNGHAAAETAWIRVDTAASHPFWSRDGRLVYYLPTTPTVDIRNRVVARVFDPRDGEKIVFLLGNYRGDIWMLDLQAAG